MDLKCVFGMHEWTSGYENICRCLKCDKVKFHEWSGCRCLKCGMTRDNGHDWSKDCEKCAICGQVPVQRTLKMGGYRIGVRSIFGKPGSHTDAWDRYERFGVSIHYGGRQGDEVDTVGLHNTPDQGCFVGELPGKLTFGSRLDEVERLLGSGSRYASALWYVNLGIACEFENSDLTGRLVSVFLKYPGNFAEGHKVGNSVSFRIPDYPGHKWSETSDTCVCVRCGKTRAG